MEEIRIQSVVVPEVVLVILALPVAVNHEVEEARHAERDVSPEDGTQQVEPAVDGSEDLVVRVRAKATLVRCDIWESLLELSDSMLHQSEGAKPEDGDAGAGVGPPVPVEVHLDVLVEDAVTTSDRLSVDTISVIADLLRHVLDRIQGLSGIRLVERKEALRARRW